MILEEATKEAFGYYPRDLKPRSSKKILAACELCGEFKITAKHHYCALCRSCAKKGENHPNYDKTIPRDVRKKIGEANKGKKRTEEQKRNMRLHRPDYRGARNPMFGKRGANYGKRGAEASGYKDGLWSKDPKEYRRLYNAKYSKSLVGRISERRSRAKRKRELGYTYLMPLKEGEAGHHVTNEYVIGVPLEVHQRLSGGRSRRKHRTNVLQWLKTNDKKKYKLVLCVLASQSHGT